MKRVRWIIAVVMVAFSVGGYTWYIKNHSIKAGVLLSPDDAKIVALGKTVYVKNCASCHGKDLEGQPNWKSRDADGLMRAPPHNIQGHTWHHADGLLFELTKYGPARLLGKTEYRTNMPKYDGVLTDAQIVAVLSYIKSSWPEFIRKRHDQLNAQHGVGK